MTGGGPQKPRLAQATDYGRYAGLGFQFAGTMLVFGALGWWLDERLGSGPWLLIGGVFLGATGAFLALLRAVGSGTPPGRLPKRPRGDPPQSE